MGFLDKAKAAAEQAATKAKEGVDDVQTKRELSQVYNELGKTAYELIESGELSHPRLEAPAEKIRTLNAKTATDDGATTAAATAGATTEPSDSSQPPAMPN
jgi:hypothetical protein